MTITLSGVPRRLRQLALRLLLTSALLLALAAAGAMAIILRVDFDAAEKAAIARLEQETGLSLHFAARRESRFLSPYVVYEGLSLRRGGSELIRARSAFLRLGLNDLLDGQINSPTIALHQAEAVIETALITNALRSPKAILDMLERLPGLFEHQSAIERLNLSIDAGRLVLRGAGGAQDGEFGPLALALEYSAPRGRFALRLTQAGSGLPGKEGPLAQEKLKLALNLPTRAALAGGGAEEARIEASLGDSSFVLLGGMRARPDTTFSGRIEAQFGGVFDRLLGLPHRARMEPGEPASLDADLTLDARRIGFDNLRLGVGRRAVTGIATLRATNERWGISATLGGNLIDGTAAYRVLQGIRDEKGGWSQAPLNLNPLPQIDLDLRLSTKAFRLGQLALAEVGISVLTRAQRSEMAIVDSRFGEGSFKARVVVGEAEGGGQTLKLIASGENLESGELLARALGFERLSGLGSFVIHAVGQGRSLAALVGSLSGTAAFDIKDGVVNGIDLNRLMNRSADQRAETALLFSLVGKTPFEAFRADFALREGRLETVGSRFLTKTSDAVMEGYSDFGAQQHHQNVVMRKRGENDVPQGEFFGFRMEGPLFSPQIKPDLRLLQDRR